jgi:acid phosphatase class B
MINNNITSYLLKQIKTNFTYLSETATNTITNDGSNRITNYKLNFIELECKKGDRVLIVDGANEIITYINDVINSNTLLLEDNISFTSTNATITIYFLPKIYKEYADETETKPYSILSFIGRKDNKFLSDGFLTDSKFQIYMCDDNSDDTNIENIGDEYIRVLNTLEFEDKEVRLCDLELDSGLRVNKNKINSTVILERVIAFRIIIR